MFFQQKLKLGCHFCGEVKHKDFVANELMRVEFPPEKVNKAGIFSVGPLLEPFFSRRVVLNRYAPLQLLLCVRENNGILVII